MIFRNPSLSFSVFQVVFRNPSLSFSGSVPVFQVILRVSCMYDPSGDRYSFRPRAWTSRLSSLCAHLLTSWVPMCSPSSQCVGGTLKLGMPEWAEVGPRESRVNSPWSSASHLSYSAAIWSTVHCRALPECIHVEHS